MSPRAEVEQQLEALLIVRYSLGWKDDWPATTKSSLEDICNTVPGLLCDRSAQHVTVINWSSRGLSGSLPSEIGVLSRLERFQVGKNHLTGSLPDSLSRLSVLEHLEVNRNEMVGSLHDIIWSNMPALKRLLVQSNRFTGTLPSSLCQLKSLHSLDLFDNSFIGSLPECLGAMSLLRSLRIHDAQLVGTIPSSLCPSSTCDTIACSVRTYAHPDGREAEASKCLPCPTANYLGSIHCPDTLPITESDAPTNGPTLNKTEDIETSPNFTQSPSSSPAKAPSLFSPVPSSEPVPLVPSERPTPQDIWIVTLPPVATPSASDGATSAQTHDWTLLSIACLLSALAMLLVVWARQSKRKYPHPRLAQWWGRHHRAWRWRWHHGRWEHRRAPQPYHFPSGGAMTTILMRPARAQRATTTASSVLACAHGEHSRMLLLPQRQGSLSMPSSLSPRRRNGVPLDTSRPSLNGDNEQAQPQKQRRRQQQQPQQQQHLQAQQQDKERTPTVEDDSVESDSGWNDTVSSGEENDSESDALRQGEWNDPWTIHYGSSCDLTE